MSMDVCASICSSSRCCASRRVSSASRAFCLLKISACFILKSSTSITSPDKLAPIGQYLYHTVPFAAHRHASRAPVYPVRSPFPTAGGQFQRQSVQDPVTHVRQPATPSVRPFLLQHTLCMGQQRALGDSSDKTGSASARGNSRP
jgi:hypothetical protein